MDALQRLAEARLEEALAAGVFAELPGRGRPLALEDLDGLPEDLRASYLLLKGSGVLPEELQLRKELLTLGDLIAACHADDERNSLERRRSLLLARLELERARRLRD